MNTLHQILRERLLAQAGVFETPVRPIPTLDEIFKIQWSNEFESAMRNRMAMGYFRYGDLQKQIGKNKYDNIGSIKRRICAYEADNNREHLVDIANLALVEFAVNPDKPFKSVDDGIHATKRK